VSEDSASRSVPRAPSVGSAVLRFVLGSLAAIAVLMAGGYFVLRDIAQRDAQRDTRELATLFGQGIVEPRVTDGLVRGDPAAIAAIDRVVQERVIDSDRIVRVKIWSPDGKIVYSDEPQLIGQRYTLGPDEQGVLANGGAEAELSNLSRPENRFERGQGRLLEVYAPIRTPSGKPLLFEVYQRYSSVTSNVARLLKAMAPALIGAVLLLLAIQVPLAWSMARRMQRGQREREALLTRAIESSNVERRRIAADLHDGVVQNLAGLQFGLAAAADRSPPPSGNELRRVLGDAVGRLRGSIRDLRTLLVEIHPPNLQAEGLEAALSDLVAPLSSHGIEVSVGVAEDAAMSPEVEALVFRAAQEATRNVLAHAGARSVSLDVARDGALARLVVEDDGRGFDAEERAERREDGHVGLALLEDLARHAGGSLAVDSRPGKGTRLVLEVPAR